MQTTTLIGFEILCLALGLVIGLTLWCRHIIKTIHAEKLESLREINRELKRGR